MTQRSRRFGCAMGAALAAVAQVAPAIAAGERSIAGTYVCQAFCRLTDAAPSIEIDGPVAHCMNELGGTFQGKVLAKNAVACFNKVGTLSDDGTTIVWSDGVRWRRP